MILSIKRYRTPHRLGQRAATLICALLNTRRRGFYHSLERQRAIERVGTRNKSRVGPLNAYPPEPPPDLKTFEGITANFLRASISCRITSPQARQISRHIVDIFTPKKQAYIEKYIAICMPRATAAPHGRGADLTAAAVKAHPFLG